MRGCYRCGETALARGRARESRATHDRGLVEEGPPPRPRGGSRSGCPSTSSGDGQVTGVEETIGYSFADGTNSNSRSPAVRTERRLDVVGFDPSARARATHETTREAWRNLLKSRSENARNASPAVHVGIVPGRLAAWQLLCKRLFATRMELAPHVEPYYQRRIRTRYFDRQHVHDLRFAC